MSDIHPKTPTEIAAQLWCLPQHAHKEMDPDFCASIRDVLTASQRQTDAWYDTAAQHCRNEFYYRGLVEQIGRLIGVDAFTADDGGVHDSVLCAKVPALVAKLLGKEAEGLSPNSARDEGKKP